MNSIYSWYSEKRLFFNGLLTVPLCFTHALRSKHQHFPAAKFRILENIKIFYEPPGACSTDAFAKVLL